MPLEMAPVAWLNLPLEHEEHAALPVTCLYLPALHGEQCMPCGPVNPGRQLQFVIRLLPSSEKVYRGQMLQLSSDACPVDVEYLPTEHNKHGPDPFAGLNLPDSHGAHALPLDPV